MKSRFLSATAFGLLLTAGQAQAELKYSLGDSWMSQAIAPPPSPLLIDEELASFTKTASANVFADVTHIDAAQNFMPFSDRQQPTAKPRTISVGTVIADLANSMGLTHDRTSENTLVFWRRPDDNHLLDLIVAHQHQLEVANPPSDERATLEALQAYLSKNYGWKTGVETIADRDERARGIDAAIPFAALPPELRAPLEAEFRSQITRIAHTPSYRALDVAAWQQARFNFVSAARSDASGKRTGDQLFPALQLTSLDGYLAVKLGFPQFTPPEADTKARTEQATQARTPTVFNTLPPAFKNAVTRKTRGTISQNTPQFVSKPALDLGVIDGLQNQVVLTGKRQSLSALVASLQKQSGVALHLAPDSFQGSQVLASSTGMKLSDAMQALERLYLAHWKRDGEGYVLESDYLDEMHSQLSQLGIFAFYSSRFGFLHEDRSDLGDRLADEVVGALNPNQLRSAQGAPFSALPPALQQRVLSLYRSDISSPFIVAQQRLDDALSQNIQLRMAPLAPQTPSFFGRMQTPENHIYGPLSYGNAALAAYTADGQFLCEMFPSFSAATPTADDVLDIKIRDEVAKGQKTLRPH